jgi:SHS2 domain-containing protein
MDKEFEYVDHTADIEFRAFGKTLKKAFENAAKAMSNSIVDIKTVFGKKTEIIKKTSESIEAILYDFLQELLILHETKKMVFSGFEIKSLKRVSDIDGKNGWYIECKVYGEDLDTKKHDIDSYIKAITYSQMKIEKSKKGFIIQMVLDI